MSDERLPQGWTGEAKVWRVGVSDLREALVNAVIFDRRDNVKHVPGRARETSRTIKAAARRWLALTETGQRWDVCIAHHSRAIVAPGGNPGLHRCWYIKLMMLQEPDQAVTDCHIVPKLLIPADYLTEEE